MCGNASRCVGKYLYDNGIIKKELITLETGGGVKIIRLDCENGSAKGAAVDMGEPVLEPALIPMLPPSPVSGSFVSRPLDVDGEEFAVTAVSMGNPHAVIFMKDVDKLKIEDIGPKFENHPAFPRRTNTEFVEVLSRSKIKMRVWERGSGETLACGTGACAAAVACALNNLTEREVEVEARGGRLRVNWDPASNHVFLSGPAETVFTGEYIYNS